MANLASRRFRNLRKSIGPTQGKPWASPSHERKSISHIPLTRKLGSVLLPLFPVKLFHCWVPPAQIPAPPRCLLLFLLLRGSWSLSGSSFPWQGSLPSSPWLQVLLTFKPLSGSAEWFIGALPLSEFLWASPIFWSRARTPLPFQNLILVTTSAFQGQPVLLNLSVDINPKQIFLKASVIHVFHLPVRPH